MSPVFAHGQLRLYLLALLAQGPRHGYEVIQELESRFGGLYTPSPGTVYPRLAKLEEEGLVERTDEGRKATYRITPAGRAEVAARAREIESLDLTLDQSVRRLADEVRATVHGRSADLRAELRAAAREARATAQPATGQDTDRPTAGPGTAGPPPRDRDRDRDRDRGWAAATDWIDVELAVGELRRQARGAWKSHGLTIAQTRDIAAIVTEASRRIAEVLRRVD
jgi:DNA-binding PadR family transcriptional regulator